LSISVVRPKTKRPLGADPARASIHQELDKSDNIEGGGREEAPSKKEEARVK
jgi:hypothetical protein